MVAGAANVSCGASVVSGVSTASSAVSPHAIATKENINKNTINRTLVFFITSPYIYVYMYLLKYNVNITNF